MSTATIKIINEAVCKIEGLGPQTRRKLVEKFKYEIPGARFTPAVKLGRWDGKVSFFQLSGTTYINLLPDIIPVIESAGYELDLVDTRSYQLSFDLTPIEADTFADRTWPAKHPHAGKPIIFRDYQVDIINACLENPQCVVSSATGSGKTLICAGLSLKCEPHGRTVLIVPNKTLVTQTEADYRNLGLDVGVYFGDRKEYGHQHTICTWQSLNTLIKSTRNSDPDITIHDFVQDVVCVIVDECHTVKGAVLREILGTVFGSVPIRWGLTGTIPRDDHDRVSLRCLIGDVAGSLKAKELQDQGVLSSCHVNIKQLMDHRTYKMYPDELRYLTTDSARIAYISQMIQDIAAGGNTMVLVDRIATGKLLSELIPDSVFIKGATKGTERTVQYEGIDAGDDKILIATYGIAAVGISVTKIHNLVLIEPGKSFVRVIQSIGRGLRKGFDKSHVEIWDITSNCKFAKRHLTTRKKYYTESEYPYTIEKIEWTTK